MVKNVNVEPSLPIPVTDYPDRVASSMAYSASDSPAHRIYPESNDRSTLPREGNWSARQTGSSVMWKSAGCCETGEENYMLLLETSWEYPAISSDNQRQTYKQDFDAGLQEYKRLQAELDQISKELSRLDKELDDYSEDSEEYKTAAEEYNRLKEIKASADYKNRKVHCKMLKSKLSHIKRMVTDYDSRKS
uniref:Uncharacterized protein n=1 Tax=Sphaerodactylus townsendi TaxID=933632 RepID=A0ACB8EQ09_9SAUR